jgi:hypothetical protein
VSIDTTEAPDAVEIPPDARTITLPDGSELVMLPMTWQMAKAVAAADPANPDDAAPMMQAVEDACLRANFKNGRDLARQPVTVFGDIFREWNKKEDEHALPPANGQPSETPS